MNYKIFIFNIIFTINFCGPKYKNIKIEDFKMQVHLCMQHIFYQEHTYSYCKSNLINMVNTVYEDDYAQKLDFCSENLYPDVSGLEKYFSEFLVFLLQNHFNEKILGKKNKHNINYNKINLNDVFELKFNFDFKEIYSVWREYRNSIVKNIFKCSYNKVNEQIDYYALKNDSIDFGLLGDSPFSLVFSDFYKNLMSDFFSLYYENSYFITYDKYYRNLFYENHPEWVKSADKIFDSYNTIRPDYMNIVGYSEDYDKYFHVSDIGRFMPVNLIKKEQLKTKKIDKAILYLVDNNEIFKVFCFDIFLLLEKDCVFGSQDIGIFGKKENNRYIFNKDSQLSILIKFWELIISYFCMTHARILINEKEIGFYDYIRTLSLEGFTDNFQKKIKNDFGKDNVEKWIKQLNDCDYKDEEGSVINYENIKNFLKKSFKMYYAFDVINNQKNKSQLNILNTKFSFFFSYLRYFWYKNFDSFFERINLEIDSFASAFDEFYTNIIRAISKHEFLLKNNFKPLSGSNFNKFKITISSIYAVNKLVDKFIEECSNVKKIEQITNSSWEAKDRDLEKILRKDSGSKKLKECIEAIKGAENFDDLNKNFYEFLILLENFPGGKQNKEINITRNDRIEKKLDLIEKSFDDFKDYRSSNQEKQEDCSFNAKKIDSKFLFFIYLDEIVQIISEDILVEKLLDENDENNREKDVARMSEFIKELDLVESKKYDNNIRIAKLKQIADKYDFSLLPFEGVFSTNIPRDFNQENFKKYFDKIENIIEEVDNTKLFDYKNGEDVKFAIYSKDYTYQDKIMQKCFYENIIILDFIKSVYFFLWYVDQDILIKESLIKINNKISDIKKFLENEEEKLVNLIYDFSLFSDINLIKYYINNTDKLIVLNESYFIKFVKKIFHYLDEENITDEKITKITLLEFINYIKIFINHNNKKNIINVIIEIANAKISELERKSNEEIKYFIEILKQIVNYNKELKTIEERDRKDDGELNQTDVITTYREIKDIISSLKDSYEKLNYYNECVEKLNEKDLLFLVEKDLEKLNSIVGIFSFYVETFFVAQKFEIFDLDILNSLFLEAIKYYWFYFFYINKNFFCKKLVERLSEINYLEEFTLEDFAEFFEKKKFFLKDLVFNKNYKYSFNMRQNDIYYDIIISLPKENSIFFLDYYDYSHRVLPILSLNLSYEDYKKYIPEQSREYTVKKIKLEYSRNVFDSPYWILGIFSFVVGRIFTLSYEFDESTTSIAAFYRYRAEDFERILLKFEEMYKEIMDYILLNYNILNALKLDMDYLIEDTCLINDQKFKHSNVDLNRDPFGGKKEEKEKIINKRQSFFEKKKSKLDDFSRDPLYLDLKIDNIISSKKKIEFKNSDYPQKKVVEKKLCSDEDIASTIEVKSYTFKDIFSVFKVFSVLGFTIFEINNFEFPFEFKVNIKNDSEGDVNILYRLNISQIDYLHRIERAMNILGFI